MNQTPLLAAATVFLALPALVYAQDPFEFGAPAPAPAAAAPADAAPRLQPTGDLVIDAVRESNPQTPQELLKAVQVLHSYGAIDFAKGYLKQLVDAQPNPQTLAALTEEFGEGLMFRLLTDRAMQPGGKEFALAALAAYSDHVRSPQRLNDEIRALSSASRPRQASAMVQLRKASDAAVAQMMLVLADPARAAEHKVVRQAIATINPPALDMTLAALRSNNETLRQNAALVLGRLGDRRAAAYLVEPYFNESNPPAVRTAATASLTRLLGGLPSREEAILFLDSVAREFENGAMVAAADDSGRVPHWVWSDNPQGFQQASLRGDDASLAAAAELTRALHQLAPDRLEYRRRYLLAELKRAKVMGGYHEPITETAPQLLEPFASLGSAAFDDVLKVALEGNHIPAAAAAAEVLGEIGDVSLLDAPNGYPRPLAAALSHGDRRVRFAAASAIVKLAPQQSYAGAARFAEAAADFIGAEDQRSAVVCEPREQRTHTVAGLLSQNGVEGIPTYTGKTAWEAAAASPDVEFALLSWAIDRPNLSETLQMFRTDKRTRRMPIAVMTDEAHALEWSHRVSGDPLTIVVPYPHDAAGLAVDANRLIGLLDRDYVSVEERVAHAQAALGWFEAVARDPEHHPDHDLLRHFNVLERALFVPSLSTRAARVLGALATPDSQQSLLDFASQNGRPIEQRRAAAEAFASAVDRRGVQLTSQSILIQYDRYNDSANLPVETQQVLGRLLDAIEKPTLSTAADDPANDDPAAAADDPAADNPTPADP